MPRGTRILGMIAAATSTMTTQAMNSIWLRGNQVLSRRMSILAFRQATRLCTCAQGVLNQREPPDFRRVVRIGR